MTGLLEPVFKEVYQGKAEVRETFRISKVGNVAGCMVHGRLDQARQRSARCCATTWWSTPARSSSLRRFKDDVSEVKSGMECGITLRQFLRRQAGRHHRGVRHRAGRRRSHSREHGMPTIGVLTLELRPGELAFAQGQAPRREEPEGPAAQQVQRGGGGNRLPGSLAARAGRRGDGIERPRARREGAAIGGARGRRRSAGRRAGGAPTRGVDWNDRMDSIAPNGSRRRSAKN